MRCPITYENFNDPISRYSRKGLQSLSKNINILKDFSPAKNMPTDQTQAMMAKLSISAAQPQFNVTLNVPEETFELSDIASTFHLKSQSLFWSALPENEDLTMRLAQLVGLETPLHGLVYNADGSLSYWMRRLDRPSLKSPTRLKLAMEDFAQLSGVPTVEKKNSSLEHVARIIEKYATFPAVEKEKLLRLVIFNFLTGNADMHLKNIALITQDNIVKLSPVYNLINTMLAMGSKAQEEIGLSLNNKKRDLKSHDFIDCFAIQCLGIPPLRIKKILKQIIIATKKMPGLINISFLSASAKNDYIDLINQRLKQLLSQ